MGDQSAKKKSMGRSAAFKFHQKSNALLNRERRRDVDGLEAHGAALRPAQRDAQACRAVTLRALQRGT